jgi:hypothetical protein
MSGKSRTAAVGANRSEIPLLTTTAVKGLSGHNVSEGRKVDDHFGGRDGGSWHN